MGRLQFLWILTFMTCAVSQVDLILDARLVRRMVGGDVSFSWQFPFQDDSWKILYAPNGKNMVWILKKYSAPVYEHPLLYAERLSMLPNGVMLKDVSKSDEGLYRTEENGILMNNTVLFIYTEQGLKPNIFVDDTPVTSTRTQTRIQREIKIITPKQLQANITLEFSHDWNTTSCVRVHTCVYDVMNVPEPDHNYTVSIDVDYGFCHYRQLNLVISMDASHDVTNSDENIYLMLKILIPGVSLIILASVILLIIIVDRQTKKSNKNKKISSELCINALIETRLELVEFKHTVNESQQLHLMHDDKNIVEDENKKSEVVKKKE